MQAVVVALLDRCDNPADIPVVVRTEVAEYCDRHAVPVDDVLKGVAFELVDGLLCLPPPEGALVNTSPHPRFAPHNTSFDAILRAHNMGFREYDFAG